MNRFGFGPVVHLSQTDAGAGAGRAAYRVHRGLVARGVDSLMIVGDKRTRDESVFAAANERVDRFRGKVCEYVEAKYSRFRARQGAGFVSLSRCGYFDVARDARVLSADIVCLYWVNGGFISPEGLTKLRKPVVWRLSDAWPFTGGCHFPGSCERFVCWCGKCPKLKDPNEQDDSRRLWDRKARSWQDLNLTVVAPTQWIKGLAKQSSLFGGRRIEVIPTGVDLTQFKPQDRIWARNQLGLPTDKQIILFISNDILGDVRKGYSDFLSALKMLEPGVAGACHVLLVGGIDPVALNNYPMEVTALGKLSDDSRLNLAYAASDVLVCPSQEDNLPNTVLEAIATGIPVLGYDVGGMRDVIDHRINGFLAIGGDVESLTNGLQWLLSDSVRMVLLGHEARVKAETSFSAERQVDRYIDLYRELLLDGKGVASSILAR